MGTWLALAIAAQFLAAVTVLIDKHIVTRPAPIGKPIVYAFYVSLLSGFVVLIAPFGFVSWVSAWVMALAFLNAAVFVAAIYFLYVSLQHARASDAAPVVGAVSAISTVILAGIWIQDDFALSHLPALALLVAGTAVISHFHFTHHALRAALFSGFFFGAAAFTAKLVFLEVPFIDGFFWTRSMNVVIALGFLAIPALRAAILHGGRASSRGTQGLVIGNKVIGGIGGVLTAIAISLGSVSIVNALGGLQFVFLFLLAVLFARHMPLTRAKKTGSHGGWHTAIGVTLISLGLATLFLG